MSGVTKSITLVTLNNMLPFKLVLTPCDSQSLGRLRGGPFNEFDL